jgi:hypothetical protein
MALSLTGGLIMFSVFLVFIIFLDVFCKCLSTIGRNNEREDYEEIKGENIQEENKIQEV